MRREEAEEIIAGIRYKPGWSFTTPRLNSTDGLSGYFAMPDERITVVCEYEAPDSSDYPNYRRLSRQRAIAPIIIYGAEITEWEIWRQMRRFVHDAEIHEADEFFRVMPNWYAPFHPHHPKEGKGNA